MARCVSPKYKRNDLHIGELTTLERLEAALPEDWLLAVAVLVPGRQGGTRETDVVAVSPRRVYVIEVKHFRGPVSVYPNGCAQGSRHRGNPIGQVSSTARLLRAWLDGKPATGARGRRGGAGPARLVRELVVFSHETSRIHRCDGVEEQVALLADLPDFLLELEQEAEGAFTDEQREKIGNMLGGLEDKPSVPDRLGDYRILEPIGLTPLGKAYLAEHADGTEVHLEVVEDDTPTNDPDPERNRSALLREYRALEDLSGTRVCPTVRPFSTTVEGDYLIPTVHPAGRTLQQDIDASKEGTLALPDRDAVETMVREAFGALATLHAHESSPLHRSLSPERIVRLDEGGVMFTGFNLAKLDTRSHITTTLNQLAPDQLPVWSHASLKYGLEAANQRTDVYGLAMSLLAWVLGTTTGKDLSKQRLSGEARHRLGDLADQFMRLLEQATTAGGPYAMEIATEWGWDDTGVEEHALTDQPAAAPLHARPDPVDDVIDERYEIIEELGRGATAASFLARDRLTDTHCVLKSFDYSVVDRAAAQREFAMALQMTHDRLACVRSYHGHEHPFQLQVDYAEGVPAAEVDDRFLDRPEELLELARGLLEGLSYLHGKGVIHGDISASNVIVDTSDPSESMLIDFGLSRVQASTGPLAGIGTGPFRPPELLAGADPDFTSDVYAAGVLLFKLLTGVYPFAMRPTPVPDDLVPPPSHLSDATRALAHRLQIAVDPDVSGRFPNAGEFLDALDDIEVLLHDAAHTAAGVAAPMPDDMAVEPDDRGAVDAPEHGLSGPGGGVADAPGVVDTGTRSDEDGTDAPTYEGPQSDEHLSKTSTRPAWLDGLAVIAPELLPGSGPTDAARALSKTPAPEHPQFIRDRVQAPEVPGRDDTVEQHPPAGPVEPVGDEAERQPLAVAPPVGDGAEAPGGSALRLVRDDGPQPFRGNATSGAGRARRYTLTADGRVTAIRQTGTGEQTVSTVPPAWFTKAINAAKAAGGQSVGGSFLIDVHGNVVVKTGAGSFSACQVAGMLVFQTDAGVLTPRPSPDLQCGEVWPGLSVGLRFKIPASMDDIHHERAGGWVRLSHQLGPARAEAVASRLAAFKPGGGRIYVNEAGAVFGPRLAGGRWRDVYLGSVEPGEWFSSP